MVAVLQGRNEVAAVPQVSGYNVAAVDWTARLEILLTGYFVSSMVPRVLGKALWAKAVNCGSSKLTLVETPADERSGSIPKKKKPRSCRGMMGPPIVAEM